MNGHPNRFQESGLAAQVDNVRNTIKRFDEATLAAAYSIRDAETRRVEGTISQADADAMLDAACSVAPHARGIIAMLSNLESLPVQAQTALPELVNDTNVARITGALEFIDRELNDYLRDSHTAHLTNALDAGLRNLHEALRRSFGYWQVDRGHRPGPNLVADRDLSPERRDKLTGKLLAALQTWVPGSSAQLGGSQDADTADDYGDIDICWVVPDHDFSEAIDTTGAALSQCSGVLSLLTGAEFARSARRRLVFARLYDMPLLWRVNIDSRAHSVATDDLYDVGNPDACGDTRWSDPASAIEDAIAAIKAAVRGQAEIADDVLRRGCERIGHDPGSLADLASAITSLADACAAQEPDLTNIAAQVGQMADHLLRSKHPA
jgi:hypothetical protein